MITSLRGQRRLRQFSALAVVTATCSVLAACSSSAPEADQTSPSVSASPSREAGLYRSSQVCIVNNSPNIFTVNFSKKDRSSGEGVLQPNAGTAGQACASGYDTGVSAEDVTAEVTTIKPDSLLNITVRNDALVKPSFYGFVDETHTCLPLSRASVGATNTWDNGILNYTVAREADSPEFINWRVTVTGTNDPAKDGIARSC